MPNARASMRVNRQQLTFVKKAHLALRALGAGSSASVQEDYR